MKNIRLYLFIFCIIIISGCSSGNFLDLSEGAFWVFDTTKNYVYDSSAWYRIYTDVRYENKRVKIFVDRNVKNISSDDLKEIGIEFQNIIYPAVTENFGYPVDFDGNGKTSIVIYDIIDTYQFGGDPYYAGYFSPADLSSKSSVDAMNHIYGSRIKANEGDIIFIDCNPQSISDAGVLRTIAHEFQHLVNASYRLFNTDYDSDTWINEGLSEAANHICYGNVTNRINYYNANSENLVVNGHSLFNWKWSGDQYELEKTLMNYSYSYLFFQYLKGQSSSGNGIYKMILRSEYGDYRAIQDAMNNDASLSTWGSSGYEGFKKLLLRWYATNAGITGTNYGYPDGITVSRHLHLSTSPITLKDGGGIVKDMGDSWSGMATGYIYLSVEDNVSSQGDEDFDVTGGFADKDYFVTVYFNPDDMNNTSNSQTTLPGNTINSSVMDTSSKTTKSVNPVDHSSKWIDYIPSKIGRRLREVK